MRLLDLFSCAGGAAVGYSRAGFDVFGVDIKPQPHYPFPHLVGDAVGILRDLINGARFTWSDGTELGLDDFDVIHASPPCQRFTRAQSISKNADAHLDLVTPTRALLEEWGGAWIIENVPGAPMHDYVTLCGSHFGLVAQDTDGQYVQLRRHRLFESSVWLMAPGPCAHRDDMPTASVYGHGGGWSSAYRRSPDRGGGYVPHVDVCKALMGIDWPTTKREVSESIPPVYTEYLGAQLARA